MDTKALSVQGGADQVVIYYLEGNWTPWKKIHDDIENEMELVYFQELEIY